MKLRKLLFLFLTLSFVLPSLAVSDKDMEQAKVIAAKLYLRWTNNGSGYLDEVSASSMADLETKLKDQEKENLKAFKSVNIPSDYATWDKERFVQFWGTTFFTSPALSADGKRAKDRVKAKVKTLNVTAPTAAPTPAEQPKAEEAAKEATPAGEPKPEDGGISIPEPGEVVHDAEAAVADSMQMIQAEEQSLAFPERPKAKSHTWIYVVILIVLVILVVWLMVYAANMMKKQGKGGNGPQGDYPSKKELAAAEKEIVALRKEVATLEKANQRLREENEKLKSQASTATTPRQRAAEPAPRAQATPHREAAETPQPKVINEIFLGRANPKGLFVRGDRRPNPDHSVFRLNTKDGIVGTFRFLETPEAFAVATSNPLHFLAGGCICENFEDAESATRIITENPGTAILENGCWKVLRKSKIRFE
ncbi:MAG: hypothetical protein K2J70_01535 [Muribaculaceae bacterium]|nr:hypothetical protein [Muribaculaceae bacterium]